MKCKICQSQMYSKWREDKQEYLPYCHKCNKFVVSVSPARKAAEIAAEVEKLPPAPKRANKYGAKKTEVDGITFDSKKEANRYRELKLMEKAGEIKDLQLQVSYNLVVNDKLIGKYTADFVYTKMICKTGEGFQSYITVVEDAKGVRTRDYILRKKLMDACHNIQIKEV